jgi:hypothetical protein
MQYSSSKVLNEVFLLINRSKQDQRSDLKKKKISSNNNSISYDYTS